ILQWLRANGSCPWTVDICHRAAKGGQLEWLRAQDPPCPWGEVERFSGYITAATAAAKAGHLHVLEWVRAQEPPCPWDIKTCAQAAKGGHLHALRLAQ
ncbi:hypothetical protein B484DRAFT_305987, partial [Ochromonadaceae sp. CCMP2298]